MIYCQNRSLEVPIIIWIASVHSIEGKFRGVVKTVCWISDVWWKSGKTDRSRLVYDFFSIWSKLIVKTCVRFDNFIKENKIVSVCSVDTCNIKSEISWKLDRVDVSSIIIGIKVVPSFKVKLSIETYFKGLRIKLKNPNFVILTMEWNDPNSLIWCIVKRSHIIVAWMRKAKQMVSFGININYHSSIKRAWCWFAVIANEELRIIKLILWGKSALVVSSWRVIETNVISGRCELIWCVIEICSKIRCIYH